MSLLSQLESILFVASKPLSAKKLGKVLKLTSKEIEEQMEKLIEKYNDIESGIKILKNNDEWQMVSAPDNFEITEKFVKAEVSGELTRPQLETLTVISYCGPITKPELEQVRGVNCSLILRNLLIRGLIKESEDNTKLLPAYEITMDYLRLLGVEKIQDLPDYEVLSKHEFIQQTSEQKE